MIEPLSWEGRREDEENPFRKGSTRPLKVTLHSSSFANLTADQAAAIELIGELGRAVSDVDVLDTGSEANGRIVIGGLIASQDYVDVTVWIGERRGLGTYVSYPEQKLQTAQYLAGSSTSHDVQAALQDVLASEAHVALQRDLLITESKWIHDPRNRHLARRGNPRRILDGLKIIGLLLRNRDNYVFRGNRRSIFELTAFSRHDFYWVLTRHFTPSMWGYCGICHLVDDNQAGGVSAMAGSALSRCKHALLARDMIGEAFYAPHSDRASDDTIYHFDYLTVLLVGALDAQARIAHRAYGLPGSERVNFRGGIQSGFLQGLRKAGATTLFELLTDERVEALLTLLFEVRNTIHTASLASRGYHTTGSGPSGIEVDETDLGTTLWTAASVAATPDAWGLEKLRYRKGADGPLVEPVKVRPYPFAVSVVSGCLDLVDRVAKATDVSRFLNGMPGPALLVGPPDDTMFNIDVRTRLALLA